MKVGIFYNSISNPQKFTNKVMLMNNFKQGVLTSGDEIIEFHSKQLPSEPLDAGFILGYTLEDNFRKKIINTLESINAYRIFVDSNILHYSNPLHTWHRYSLNSVYPTSGIYFFNKLDTSKWDRVSKDNNVSLKPWRDTGEHILILAQRTKGWNMFGHNQERWLYKTITKIRKHSERPIVVRMHPGDNNRFNLIQSLTEKYGDYITISTNENIQQDLINCWCSVGYNSTPNVVSAIEGIPVILSDIENSWAADISSSALNTIENPIMPDRTNWINKIANIHWSNDEVISGQLWQHIKHYISSVRS